MSMSTVSPGDVVSEEDLLANIDAPRHKAWLQSIDAILLLGGGAPLKPAEPPLYVQRRCDVVANIVAKMRQRPAVVCLSAGTAHVPQYITPRSGLPLWESTASAAYLMRHGQHPVPEELVFAETTSYDTISNAFFARTTMTDIAGWKRILIVTNEFHIRRSKAIFDWIYHAPSGSEPSSVTPYELYYLSCNNVGLSTEALNSRKAHELRGEKNVRSKLSKEYTTLKGVWKFLTEKHDFYSAKKLVATAMGEDERGAEADNILKLSYGEASHGKENAIKYEEGKIVLSLDMFLVVAFLVAFVAICISLRNARPTSNRNPFR